MSITHWRRVEISTAAAVTSRHHRPGGLENRVGTVAIKIGVPRDENVRRYSVPLDDPPVT